MTAAGVPVIPGYHGESQDRQVLKSHADRIGYRESGETAHNLMTLDTRL